MNKTLYLVPLSVLIVGLGVAAVGSILPMREYYHALSANVLGVNSHDVHEISHEIPHKENEETEEHSALDGSKMVEYCTTEQKQKEEKEEKPVPIPKNKVTKKGKH